MRGMKLIAITTSHFWPGEAQAIVELLTERGFSRVHIRKPGASCADVERLLHEIPAVLRHRLSLHDCHELAVQCLAGGVHLNSRNPRAPAGFSGTVSRSCHSLDELQRYADTADYLFLSPIFDSISKTGYRAAFNLEQLAASGLIGENVVALGGVTLERLPELQRVGFGGAAMLGAAWINHINQISH